MNDAGMNGGLEAGELPAHMDTTDDLVPTLDVRKTFFFKFLNTHSILIINILTVGRRTINRHFKRCPFQFKQS